MHVYEVRPRKDKRGVDLISDALPFGRLWYTEVSDAVDYSKFYSRSKPDLIASTPPQVRADAGSQLASHGISSVSVVSIVE